MPDHPNAVPSPPGLADVILFLNAGDPNLEITEELLLRCDAAGVAWVELAVPFPNSPTDGPVIRRSADRAIAAGTSFHDVLDLVRKVKPRLQRTRLVLLADWSHTVRPLGLQPALTAIHASGADGVLLHALPPRFRATFEALAAELTLPVVTSCYVGVSDPQTVSAAAAGATAYVYLVATYGRTGGSLTTDPQQLRASVTQLANETKAPIAVGFGVRGRRDIDRVLASGAHAAVIGTACVEAIENGLDGEVLTSFQSFLHQLEGSSQLRTISLQEG